MRGGFELGSAAAVLALVGAGVWAPACTGDEPIIGPSEPLDGGLLGDGAVNDTGTTGADGAPDGAGPDASADTGADGGCGLPVPQDISGGFPCGSGSCVNMATETCCKRAGTYGCGAGSAGCDDALVDVQCDGKNDCSSLECCVLGTVLGMCPATVALSAPLRVICTTPTSCSSGNGYITCSGTGVCAAGRTCSPLPLPSGGTIGVCL